MVVVPLARRLSIRLSCGVVATITIDAAAAAAAADVWTIVVNVASQLVWPVDKHHRLGWVGGWVVGVVVISGQRS